MNERVTRYNELARRWSVIGQGGRRPSALRGVRRNKWRELFNKCDIVVRSANRPRSMIIGSPR